VAHSAAREHIRQARCLVLPSHSEAFPNVILEAMASGVPVVATRTGGIPSLVQDGTTGFLVDRGSVEQLTEAMTKLTDDSLCLQMGVNAHEAAGSFAWPSAAERLVDQIELVLKGTSSHG
jgi:glycosyltransferase involved in cell wall biosynthesis